MGSVARIPRRTEAGVRAIKAARARQEAVDAHVAFLVRNLTPAQVLALYVLHCERRAGIHRLLPHPRHRIALRRLSGETR
jgi:hypothetical protein